MFTPPIIQLSRKEARIPFLKMDTFFFLPALLCVMSWNIQVRAQSTIFLDDWQPSAAVVPLHQRGEITTLEPQSIITIDFRDTSFLISPYISGFNQPVHQKGRFDQEPQAVRHTKNVDAKVLRYPGGTAAMTFFWDRTEVDGPPGDVDTYIRSGEVANNFRLGMSGGDFFSVDNYYNFLDSVPSMTGIIVVNYGYARYGRSENPVQQAAHYAAEWVRYDNGRTRFWEIGNELSGRWTPGHTIDIDKNKDGQPEIITGRLYAEHFRIFADSMKSAAAESGHEIYLGGVLSHSESTWNREFLENASDEADFVIEHEYYGEQGVTDPLYAVNSSDALAGHAANAFQDISAYAGHPIPLVMTEWNTKDEEQNDRCIYGMSNMRGISNIIQSGMQLACRHTLIHSNQRGLINNAQVYDPELGHWQPRSSFFYFYYMSKVLGDTWHGTGTEVPETIDVMTTSFRSGEAGLIFLNKSGESRIVALNMKHYRAAGKYYSYSLVPDGGNPFSEKVTVNGSTNEFYPAGGPFNYEALPARSFETDGFVKVELPPYSANYILVEGARIAPDPLFNVQIETYESTGDSVIPLQDVLVALNSECSFSGDSGKAVFSETTGIHALVLQKNGFENIHRNITISRDTIIRDTLQRGAYNLEIVLKDQESQLPLANLPVIIDDNHLISDQEGRVLFGQLTGGDIRIEIQGPGYEYSGLVRLYSDTTQTIWLEKISYTIDFRIYDLHSRKPLSGITVEIGDSQVTSDLEGSAVFTLISDEYQATFSGEKHESRELIFSIDSDTLLEIHMIALFADVKIKVYEGNTPLNSVPVSLEEQSGVTNALGIYTFSDLPTGRYYAYSVVYNGYSEVNDTLFLLADSVVDVAMVPGTFAGGPGYAAFSVYPVPSQSIVHLQTSGSMEFFRLLNLEGKEMISGHPAGKKETTILLDGLEAGAYILEIELTGHIYRQRIIVKK